MPGYLVFLVVLTSSPFVTFLLHLLLARTFGQGDRAPSSLAVAALAVACGYPIMSLLLWQCHLKSVNTENLLAPCLFALIVYSCLSFCYFILFTMTETARRIHLLRKLQERDSIPLSDMAASYNSTDMLSVRLERMVALKQLKRVGERYYLHKRLLWCAAKAVSAWAKVLRFDGR